MPGKKVTGASISSFAKRPYFRVSPLDQKGTNAEQCEIGIMYFNGLIRIEKYGPGSEKLSDAQLELLELEPG
jgi:hypothetical protein